MKIKFLSFLTILTMGMVICLASIAMAWTLPGTFIENGTNPNGVNYGQFNKIEAFMIDGTTFDAPFIQEASIAGVGWSSTLVNSVYSLATGPLTDILGPFTVELPDPQSTAHVFDYFVYRDDTLLYSQRITWNGTGSGGDYNGWSYPILDSDGSTYIYNGNSGTYDRASIPPSVLLMGTGLLGVIGLRQKFWSGNNDDFI